MCETFDELVGINWLNNDDEELEAVLVPYEDDPNPTYDVVGILSAGELFIPGDGKSGNYWAPHCGRHSEEEGSDFVSGDWSHYGDWYRLRDGRPAIIGLPGGLAVIE